MRNCLALVLLFFLNAAWACSVDIHQQAQAALEHRAWNETVELTRKGMRDYPGLANTQGKRDCLNLLRYEFDAWHYLQNYEQAYQARQRHLTLLATLDAAPRRDSIDLTSESVNWMRNYSWYLKRHHAAMAQLAERNAASAARAFPGTTTDLLARFHHGSLLFNLDQTSAAAPILAAAAEQQLARPVLEPGDEQSLFRVLALAFNAQNKNAEATRHQLRYLARLEQTGRGNSAEFVKEAQFAAQLMLQSNYADSLALAARALQQYRKLGLDDPTTYREILNTHVQALRALGRNREAATYTSELLRVQEGMPAVSTPFQIAVRLHELLYNGLYAEALRLVQARLQSVGARIERTELLTYLDWFASGHLLGTGKFSREQASRTLINMANADGDKARASRGYYKLALALEARSAHSDALQALETSIQLGSSARSADPAALADVRARLLYALGRPVEGLKAKVDFAKYMRATAGDRNFRTIDAVHQAALAYAGDGKLELAMTTAKVAVDAVEALYEEQRYAPLTDLRYMFSRYDAVVKAYAQILFQNGRHSHAFAFIERMKARTATLQALQAANARSDAFLPKERAAIAAAAARINAADKDIATAATTALRHAAIEQRIDAAGALRAAHQSVLKRKPQLAALESLPEVSHEQLAFLDAQTRYVSIYQLSPGEYGAMILDSKGKVSFHALSPSFPLEEAAEAFAALPRGLSGIRLRNHMNQALQVVERGAGGKRWWTLETIATPCPDSTCGGGQALAAQYKQQFDALAQAFGKELVAPIWNRIKDADRLIISSESGLALIPWDLVMHAGTPLVEHFSMSYAPNLWSVREVQRRLSGHRDRRAGRPLLAFGNPDYSRDPDTPSLSCAAARRKAASWATTGNPSLEKSGTLNEWWFPLDFSHCELSGSIAAAGGAPRDLIERAEASEERLKAMSGAGELLSYDTLLFSSHGQFSVDEPLMSGLILQKSGSGTHVDNDGMVTLGDWAELRLRSALVVLSGCNTARGEVVPGDGILSMPTVLLAAGNANTIGSLWSIDDEGSAAFVQAFFSNYRQSRSARDALWKTKRQFRIHPHQAFRNPSVWAAFVLFGV